MRETLFALFAAIFAASAGVAPGRTDEAKPALDDRIVVNAVTGLAISGFDPVGYFTRGAPVEGTAQFELRLAGVIWRFANEGNRAAFAANPEVYAPRFGGFDPVAVGRDLAVAGHPQIWVLSGERLYFFYSDAARAEFLADPAQAIARATQKWPDVAKGITR